MDKGKLVIVVNVDWFFLSHRLPVALAARDAGWDVTIVTADTGRLREIESYGLKTVDLPMSRRGMNPFEELRTLNFLRRLYKRESPDVVHHVGLKAILWGSMAARTANVKGVVNAVSGLGVLFEENGGSLIKKSITEVLKFSHKRPKLLCIFQNDDDRDFYISKGIIKESQARMIKGSGVDLDEFSYTPEPESGKLRVILTARMILEKGIFLLAEAAERLRGKYEETAEFLLVGGLDDHPDALSKEQIEKVCDGKYIQWLGFRTDVRELLQSSHIFVLPSFYKEGLPKSLIEAAAVGRPIITSNSVGCRETVIDGYNGFLIAPKDIDALTQRLDQLLSEKELRVKMGKNSREFAEKHFDIKDVQAKHLAIYQELANQ